jgi:Spy/CpxP family protein refolding chaperone
MVFSNTDLDRAQCQLDAGTRRVWKQRELVARLEANGHDSHAARDLLTELERAVTQCQAHRDAIREDLKRRPVAWAYPNRTS